MFERGVSLALGSKWMLKKAVAVCSGLHITPNIPLIKGIENAPTSMHSSEFEGRQQFAIGKNVMILGSGETCQCCICRKVGETSSAVLEQTEIEESDIACHGNARGSSFIGSVWGLVLWLQRTSSMQFPSSTLPKIVETGLITS
jgi:hypothetical protein